MMGIVVMLQCMEAQHEIDLTGKIGQCREGTVTRARHRLWRIGKKIQADDVGILSQRIGNAARDQSIAASKIHYLARRPADPTQEVPS